MALPQLLALLRGPPPRPRVSRPPDALDSAVLQDWVDHDSPAISFADTCDNDSNESR